MKVSLVLVLVVCAACISLADKVQQHKSSHSGAEGQGHDSKGGEVAAHKHKTSSGKSSKHDHDSAKKGQELKQLHKSNHFEKGGKKSKDHHEDSYKSSKQASGGSHHGLKYADGKKHKKGNYLKGFREKFHKDEEKKHDSFFSNGEKSGEYEIYGKKNSKYASDVYMKKNKKNHKNSASAKSGGKAYKSGKAYHDSDHKAHQAQGGSKSHHKSAEKYGGKGGSHGGKKYKVVQL